MFTGIVKEVGKVKQITKTSNLYTIVIECSVVNQDVTFGDSIAVNGVCLTVSKFTKHLIYLDVAKNTLKITNIKNLKPKSLVNLEAALTLNDKLGGHLVSGHVDKIVPVIKVKKRPNEYIITCKDNHEGQIINKGSVCLEGVSLTICNLTKYSFDVSLIKTTRLETTLQNKKVGDFLNLEYDLIGKYVKKENQIKNYSDLLKIW